MDSYTGPLREYRCWCKDMFNDPTARVTQERVTRYVITYVRHTRIEKGKRVGGGMGKSKVDNVLSALRWLKVRLSHIFV